MFVPLNYVSKHMQYTAILFLIILLQLDYECLMESPLTGSNEYTQYIFKKSNDEQEK